MYYKWFIHTVDVAETLWGELVPTKKVSTNSTDTDVRNKFLACVFLRGANERYDKPIAELNNTYIMGTDKYLTTVEKAMTMLANYHHTGSKAPASRSDRDPNPPTETSFAQCLAQTSGKYCWCCGDLNHKSPACPKKDSRPWNLWVKKGLKTKQEEQQHLQDAREDAREQDRRVAQLADWGMS